MIRAQFILFLALMPITANASLVLECKKFSFLKKGFELGNYKHCKRFIEACPKTGPYPDANCVKKTTKKNIVCAQTNMLANAIQATPANITINGKNNFLLVDQLFYADGQHSYYLITPQNCLINTKIDPRNLSIPLQKQYKNSPFMITNWGEPEFKTINKNETRVTAKLKITKTCLACDVIGYAKVRFDFDKSGKLHNVTLSNFSKRNS